MLSMTRLGSLIVFAQVVTKGKLRVMGFVTVASGFRDLDLQIVAIGKGSVRN